MREPLLDTLMLAAALLASTAGMAWLALAMETHWEQVRGTRPPARGVLVTLRVLGSLALLGSLLLCLRTDHASMAALVWVMDAAAAALTIAFTLSWRPRVLAPLVAWVRTPGSSRTPRS